MSNSAHSSSRPNVLFAIVTYPCNLWNIYIVKCFEAMIRTRHQQQTLWGGVWAQEVDDLWEPWMRQADQVLDDDELVTKIFEAKGKRWKKIRTPGALADSRGGPAADLV